MPIALLGFPRVAPNPARARLALLCVVALASCAPNSQDELLQVDPLPPTSVNPGATLSLTGEGFPAGRSGRLTLHGTASSPGRSPRDVTVSLAARARSGERLEAALDEGAASALGSRATFMGTATVAFPRADGRGEVVGHAPVNSMDVTPSGGALVHRRLRDRRAAEALLSSLGLRLGEPERGQPGLPIVDVVPDGHGARTGLIAGVDRIVALDGVNVARLTDLAPDPASPRGALGVLRDGESEPFEVEIALSGARLERGDDHADAVAWGLCLVWALAALLMIAPTAGAATWLAGGPARPERRSWWQRASGLAAGLAALSVIPAAAHDGWLEVQVEVIAGVVVALRLGAGWLTSEGMGVRARARRGVIGASGAALFAVGMIGLAARAGTTDLATIGDQAGLDHLLIGPWTHGVPWISSLSVASAAAILIGGAIVAGPPRAGLARGLDDAALLALSALATAGIVGLPGAGGATAGAAGLAHGSLFVALSALAWCWTRHRRDTTATVWAGRKRGRIAATWFALSGAASVVVLQVLWPPGEALDATLGIAAGVGASMAIGLASRIAVQRTRGRAVARPDELVPAHPFL